MLREDRRAFKIYPHAPESEEDEKQGKYQKTQPLEQAVDLARLEVNIDVEVAGSGR